MSVKLNLKELLSLLTAERMLISYMYKNRNQIEITDQDALMYVLNQESRLAFLKKHAIILQSGIHITLNPKFRNLFEKIVIA